jgi:hypothetical protein
LSFVFRQAFTHNNLFYNVGKIEDFVMDVETGRIAYTVLSFGGFLGMGEKLFAVPFQSMPFDVEDEEFVFPLQKHSPTYPELTLL